MNLANLIDQVLDGKYLIERQLGKGGMGAVFLSTHLGTKRHVAVKVIMPQYMKEHEFIERFRREAEAAGRLRHPNVVDVTDFGFASFNGQQIAYLVMEYLDGCALDEILEGGQMLPPDVALDIIEQTCSAVNEAHRQGIIHRDLKPANIWLEPNRRGGFTVKVLDFGIAKLESVSETSSQSYKVTAPANGPVLLPTLNPYEDKTLPFTGNEETLMESTDPQTAPTEIDAVSAMQAETVLTQRGQSPTNENAQQPTVPIGALTRHGSLLGTPLYMSPEQWSGQALDARSDVYSLGVIAYQMLSGRTPFAGDFQSVMQAHIMTPPPRLKVKGLSGKATRVVISALEKDPSRRPASASAFSNKLRANSEGVFTVLRNSLTVFSQYITKFLLLGFFVLLPFNLIVITQSILYFLYYFGILSRPVAEIIYALLDLVRIFVRPYTLLILTGLITWLIASINAAPLRPVKIRSALLALKDKLAALTLTGLVINILFFVGLVLLIIPGVFLIFKLSLTIPATLVENLRGTPAMKRSWELTKRSRRSLLVILALQFLAPIGLAVLIAFLINSVLIAKGFPPNNDDLKDLVDNIYKLLWLPLDILFCTFTSIAVALLYLKTRRAGGEDLDEWSTQFESYDRQQNSLQARLRRPTKEGN